jgi:hypothetical protein
MFFGLVASSLAMVGPVGAADGDDNQIIRPYANGAGPTAIFRFGRQQDRDVFAVVDPTLWRIQFFTLKDPDGSSFLERFTKRGDCLLPPTFRVWRVHQHENRVVLQSQPDVPVKALIFGDKEKPQPITFRALSLPAAAADIGRVMGQTPTSVDDKPGPDRPCSSVADMEKLPLFTKSDAATKVEGGGTEIFSVSRINPPKELGEFGRTTYPLAIKGRYLVSAQELEYGSIDGVPVRHFLVTTRTAVPGFVSTEVVLVRRSLAGPEARMRINLGLSRVKMGHRNVAISSKGEVLVMGAFDKQQFRVHACPFETKTAEGNKGAKKNKKAEDAHCDIPDVPSDPATQPGSSEPPPSQASPSPVPQKASKLWQQAFNYSEQFYNVDIGNLPDDCLRLKGNEKTTASCNVAEKFPWTPLSELRFANGSATRKGVPYAQNSGGKKTGDKARPLFKASDKIGKPISKPIRDVSVSPPFVFGDIENADKTISSDDIVVFGIDCSAFLSQLWGLEDAAETETLIKRANEGKGQIKRLNEIKEAHIGDAFVINIKNEVSGVHLLNHVVVYQQDDQRSGPTDSSHAVFVVESSSSCGGVCWSFYDESFFHGWGIIKHEHSKDPPQGMPDIPLSVSQWQNLFATFDKQTPKPTPGGN